MRYWRIAALFAAGAVLGLVFLAGRASLGAEAPADARQRVTLASPARDRILAEMRAMLQSLHGIIVALGAGDRDAAAKAARASGMGTAADVEPEIKRQLPPSFLALGKQTHTTFDRLADDIQANGPGERTLKALGALTANCVACHSLYRLDEAR